MGRKRKKGLPVHGWLILDKPEELTSTQAVGKTRWLLNAQKAGHGGTLDPLATGILPIAFGEATKTVPYVMEAIKSYRFTIRFGESTTSQDREGEVYATSDARPTPEQIEQVLEKFHGEIDQVPPKFSAIKVNGERAYDLARDGEEVELKARKVHLYEAKFENCPSPDLAVFSVTTGKGFYIRSLVRDICAELGVEGHCAALRRTRVGSFFEESAITLEKFEEIGDRDKLEAQLVPVETALDDIPALAINQDEASKLRQGREIVLLPHLVEAFKEKRRPRIVNGEDASRIALAKEDGKAVALGEVRAGRFVPVRVFNF
ncbi:tRNA pseudouridine(55) synthase TruB [Hirschia maritima]|uniref:tRNA pseudouridine(55) synthase TruB n=1 Tax=Hirschia maritima TaxID=1121961 RepID=UPI000364D7DF|nr:tRNA pseudouridine(55) synthase TruB [Hirschia maritima]